MKKAILIILISFSGFAQIKHPNTDFELFDQKVYWEHIYNVPGKNTDDLLIYFQKEVLHSFTYNNLQILDNSLSFTINRDIVDYKKYGGTAMGTAIFVSYPMDYVVIVDFKDEKYKVTIKDIKITGEIITLAGLMINTSDITDYFTKKKKTEFSSTSNMNTSISYYHKYFTDKYVIKNTPTNKDW